MTAPVLAGPDGPVDVFDPPPDRRRFAPTDRLRLVVGIGVVLAGTVVARVAQDTVAGLEEDLLRAFARLPDDLESVVLSAAQLATSLIPATAFVVLLVRRRWRVALLLLVTSLLANLAMTAGDVVAVDRELDQVLDQLRADEGVGDPSFPNSHLVAMTTAQVTVAAAFLSRRWKRVLWWGVVVLVLLRLLAVTHPAFDVLLAVGVGVTVGSLVLLVYGSPTNEPGPRELVDALRAIGLRPRRVERPDPVGSGLQYRVVDVDGATFHVELRTPDERDADLLARAYRGLRFQSSEVGTGFSSIKRRIEHEALVLVLAERAGVHAPHLVQIGTTDRGSAFLVATEPAARPITADDLASRPFLDAVWEQVDALHRAGVAHRRLTLERLTIDGSGEAWLHGFDEAQTAPSEQELARDVAELLTETALVVGPEAAVEAAIEAIGADRVAPALRMLQPLALPPATRGRAKEAPGLLDELRQVVRDRTGSDELQLDELERIKPRTVLIVVASAIAFYALLPQLANLSDTLDTLPTAQFQWIAAALLASAVTYLFAAVSFSGAVAEPVPFAPNVRAQVAASFAGLVGPAGSGGFALTGRFLQRLGIGGAEAAASVAVNAVGGFAVHAALLAAFIVWSGESDLGGFSLPDSTTVLLVVAVVLALLGVLAAFGPVRRRVIAPAWTQVRTGLGQIGAVFRRPERVAALFGGSVGLSLTYIVAMACSIQAFGGGIGFVQIGAGYLFAVAIATLAPTPGGLGALESALIAAFTGFGLDDGVAVSSVLTFRLATFWLPLLPGWLTMGWMQRNDEL